MSYGVVGGYGLIFRLVPPNFGQTRWAEVVLYNFDIRTSGTTPIGELVRDRTVICSVWRTVAESVTAVRCTNSVSFRTVAARNGAENRD